MAVAAAVTAVPSAQQKENPDAAVELELYQMLQDLVQVPLGCLSPPQPLTRDMLACLLGDTLYDVFCRGVTSTLAGPKDKVHESTHTFQSKSVPTITITKYLQRITLYTGVSAEVLLMSVFHILRINTNCNFPVNCFTLHRLLLTSVLCTAKYFDDHFFSNAFFARVGGISNKEMNILEREFLWLIGFELHITATHYERIFREVVLQNDRLPSILREKYPEIPESPPTPEASKSAQEKEEKEPPGKSSAEEVAGTASSKTTGKHFLQEDDTEINKRRKVQLDSPKPKPDPIVHLAVAITC